MTIAIEGMHCDACVRRVKKALETAGVTVEQVEVGSAHVSGDVSAAMEAIRKAGYEPKPSE
jgi:copper chaperone CopZ